MNRILRNMLTKLDAHPRSPLAFRVQSASVRPQSPMTEISPQAVKDVYARITDELGKVMVGQEAIIRLLLVSLFARGHCLLIGVPGLAKTLLVRSLAETLTLSFKRIQFTPDLMPSDIIGSELLQERDRKLDGGVWGVGSHPAGHHHGGAVPFLAAGRLSAARSTAGPATRRGGTANHGRLVGARHAAHLAVLCTGVPVLRLDP